MENDQSMAKKTTRHYPPGTKKKGTETSKRFIFISAMINELPVYWK